jgi:hypothetical protein
LSYALGFSFDLLPRTARDAPAGQLQVLLSAAIILEGRIGVVKAATVGLDDQARVAPEKVRLEPTPANIQGNVHLRRGESTAGTHVKKHALQFAPGPLGLRMQLVKDEA